ncbi:MAG: hypothetical protein QXV74_08305, partial [Candidatus Bathyarchaeia archaeon]
MGVRGARGISGRWLTIVKVALILSLILAITLLCSRLTPSNRDSGSPASPSVDMFRAAIVDGIGFTRPNPSFTQGVKDLLEGAGLRVDIYEGG